MHSMNPKTVIGLGIAAVVAIAVAAGISVSRRPVAEHAQGSDELLPGLAERVTGNVSPHSAWTRLPSTALSAILSFLT